MVNNKGVTPIIAIVLLLMITVAVTGAVSIWLTSVQQRSQTEIEESTKQITSQTQQAIGISFKSCKTANITMNVRNTGTKRIDDGSVELVISDEDGITDLAYGTQPSPWASLDVDDSEELFWDLSTFSPAITLSVGGVYGLKVTVPGGTNFQTTCTAIN